MRLSSYGACAAVGLVLAMALSRRTARRAGFEPEAVWDAGLFAIICCFVASRLLLVLRDPVAFTRFPLLVLSLPSLTYGGMALAAVLLWAYLRRKRLAVLPLLDVFAAPAALLTLLLEIGHWMDGSEVGMPTGLPWHVRDPWGPDPVHPVALYGAVTALVMGLVLWQLLGRLWPGRVAAVGLMLSGAAAFGLDMLSQPNEPTSGLLLEPGQWMALGVMLAGTLLWAFARSQSAQPDVVANVSIPPFQQLHTEVR